MASSASATVSRPGPGSRQGAKRRLPRADAELIEGLRERCGGEVRKGALFAKHGAADFRLRILPKQQGYLVSVVCRNVGHFRVTRKGTLDRRMEAFVPALEFRSRDPHFDREFNVQTRDLRLTSAILHQLPLRAAVRQLFARGVHVLHLDGDRVKATLSRKAFGGPASADAVLGLIEELTPIAEAATSFAARFGARSTPKHDPVVVASWTTLGVLGVCGFSMLIVGSIEFTLVQPARFLWPCAWIGLPAALAVVVALAFAVRRRTSPYGLVRGLTFLSLLVVPLFVSGAMLLSNGLLDRTAAEERVVSVVGKSTKKNKNELRYHAGLASWWTEGEVRWVRISKATYDALEPHASRMRVRTHPGRLGYEWIEGYDVH